MGLVCRAAVGAVRNADVLAMAQIYSAAKVQDPEGRLIELEHGVEASGLAGSRKSRNLGLLHCHWACLSCPAIAKELEYRMVEFWDELGQPHGL